MTLSPAIAEKFCEVCEWAHTVWSMQKAFERDARTSRLSSTDHGYFLHNLSMMSVEYTMLQMAKLHDPAGRPPRTNLSLAYVTEQGGWEPKTLEELRLLSAKLGELHSRIRVARNRVIAHNDLATLMAGDNVGDVPEGMDDAYFRNLEQFASLVHERACGGPFEFSCHAATDVFVLLKALSRSVAS